MNNKEKMYNWISSVARLIPTVEFREPSHVVKDGRTELCVILDDQKETFIMLPGLSGERPATPEDVVRRFLQP